MKTPHCSPNSLWPLLVRALLLTSIFFGHAPADTLDAQWNVALLQGKKVGYLNIVRQSSNDTIITHQTFVLQLNRGSSVIVSNTDKTTTWESPEGKPYRFIQERASGKSLRTISGTIVDGTTLNLSIETGGRTKKQSIPWRSDALLFQGIRALTMKTPPQSGRTFSYLSFDFDVLDFTRSEVKVGHQREVPVFNKPALLYQVTTVSNVGGTKLEQTSYVDSTWTEKKSAISLGALTMELIECSKEVALGENETFDIMTNLLIPSTKDAGNPVKARLCVYDLTLPPDITLPTSDEQSVSVVEGRTVVTVRRLEPRTGQKSPTLPNEVQSYLKPSRHVESDAPEILALATSTVKGIKDPWKAAQKLRSLARSYIKTKSMDVGFASAREVFTLKEGDCTEHAVFTAALCRAAGIPSRVVVGIVRPSWSTQFLHHAWTQVYVGGVWLSIDSALEDFHPGYIALAHDADESSFVKLGSLLGKVVISNMSVR